MVAFFYCVLHLKSPTFDKYYQNYCIMSIRLFCFSSITAFLVLLLPPTIKADKNDSLLQIINTSTNQLQVLEAKIELSKRLSWTDTQSARRLQQTMMHEIEQQAPETRAEYYNASAIRLWFDRQYDSAIAVLSQTIALNHKIPDALLAEAINNTGTLYNILGKSDSAAHYLLQAVDIDLRRNELNGLAKSYYDLGILYKRKDHNELAVHYLHEAIKIQEKLNVPSRLIRTLEVTANLYAQLKDTANARRLFAKALMLVDSLADAPDNSEVKASLYSNYAFFLLNRLQQPNEALSFAMKSIELYEGLGAHKSSGAAYANVGSAYIALGDWAKGLNHFRKALKESGNIGLNGKADLLSVYAGLLLEAGMVDSAIFYNEQAAVLINQLDTYRLKSRYYQNNARIDSARSNFKSAFENLKRYQQYEDSALNFEHLSRIEELKVIHQLESKEKENQLLRDQNQMKERVIINQRISLFVGIAFLIMVLVIALLQKRARNLISLQKDEIERKNEELSSLNTTKDKFISIIAHDLKSPFNALLGSLDLLTNTRHQLSEAELQQLLKAIHESSTNTYNLLINLLDWTMAQKDGFQNAPQRINLHVLTEQVFGFLKSRAEEKKHRLLNLVDQKLEVFIDPDILRNICINLVNNAIKFTPEGGEISVAATINNGMLKFCVHDNGIGIPADKIDSLFNLGDDFKRKGTNKEPGTGLGLVLVKEFIALLNGRIQVESEENKGSTFCVQLPVVFPEKQ